MKVWNIVKLNLLLSIAFASTPAILSAFGIDFLNTWDYTLQSNYDVQSQYTSFESQLSEQNDVSLFALPISMVITFISIVKNFITANYEIMMFCHVPKEIWGIYAAMHYLSLIAFLYYIATGKQIDN